MLRTYRYRLLPTKPQAENLEHQLALCCELYNAALQERRDAWRLNRVSISYFDQTYQLPEIKNLRPELAEIQANAVLDVLKRVDKAFKAFFRRVKGRQTPGFPRFKSFRRYDSLTLRQIGSALTGNKLRISKVGQVRIKLHRPVEGTIKALHVKREAGRWYALFVCECKPKPLAACNAQVGVDVGLAAFATLDDGTEIENPRYFRNAQARLRRAQRKVARRKKGSERRRKAVQLLQSIHAHVRNQRADFHHKVSRWLVDNHGLIAVEDLNVKGLAKSRLAKSVHDAGWGYFIEKLAYKAESAGRVLVKVDPRGTSQTCVCGAEVRKTLSERRHDCQSCGLSLPRDHVSAQLILGRAVRLQASTWPVAASVA
jgi:putative transposase